MYFCINSVEEYYSTLFHTILDSTILSPKYRFTVIESCILKSTIITINSYIMWHLCANASLSCPHFPSCLEMRSVKAIPMNLWYRNLKARPSNPLSDKYLDAIIYGCENTKSKRGCENTKSKRENERAEYPIDATAILFNAVVFVKA